MTVIGALDVERADVSWSSNGAVIFDDPHCPYVVRIWTRKRRRGRPGIGRILITARDGAEGIKRRQLGGLPLLQMLHIATAEATTVRDTPNELYFRKLATPKPVGQRNWDDGHWQRVLAVYEWARASGRQGGGVTAVAELWGVARVPTVQRWLAEARRRRKQSSDEMLATRSPETRQP